MTQILPGDLDDAQVIALLTTHRHSASIAASGERELGLYLSGLRAPNITLWAAWDADPRLGGTVLGIGAICELSREHGEVKHMHTAEAARRRGIATMMLAYVMGAARERGYARLSLETGSRDAFAPARALYRANGFADCGPFANYALHPVSVFMTIDLEQGDADRERTNTGAPPRTICNRRIQERAPNR